jgi:hypothetical protein
MQLLGHLRPCCNAAPKTGLLTSNARGGRPRVHVLGSQLMSWVVHSSQGSEASQVTEPAKILA